MADKLSTYGHNFQVKVISSLLTDRIFLQQVSDIMSPAYFESQANQWIVDTIKTYFVEYGSIPTLDVFKIKTQEESSDILKTSIIDNLREVFKYIESDDLNFVKEESLKFCKNQEIKKAIMDSVDLLKRGQYEDIKKRIDEAMKAGADKDIGYEYLMGIAERYTTNVRNTMPTCWPLINDLAGGGFGKGELIIFVAGPGGGKCIGPNTSIDIQYEEVGIEMTNSQGMPFIFWIDPFVIYEIDNHKVQGIEVINLLQGLPQEK